ncbi:MAG: IscS subfamily cysteine desulfurase, partial [endosymbiont of Galathealinum brachiosum]
MNLPIYFDYSATTPVDQRVADVMIKYLTVESDFGNAASRSHSFGWAADEAIDTAR